MDTILTYLRWRGDLSFLAAPFTEVDNLILSEFVYLKMAPVLSEDKALTVKEVWEQRENLKFKNKQELLLKAMAESVRYGSLKIRNYREIFETGGEGIQFAAVEICLPDESSYLAFRGTDLSIVGWKEDFCMGYKIVPAQKEAVRYLEEVTEGKRAYRLGGHSKGGNLAIYGAMMCEPVMQQRIIEIYNNDGPGLCQELVDQEKYEAIRHKIVKIVPEFSVFGQLFRNGEQMKIVKSSAPGFLQHDGMYWQIDGAGFVEVGDLDRECIFYNEIFDEWLKNADMEEREQFITQFFSALESTDALSMDELLKGGPKKWQKVLLSMKSTDHRARSTLIRFLRLTWERISQVSLWEVFQERKAMPWFALLWIGILFLTFPGYSGRILGTAAFLGVFAYVLIKLLQYEKQRRQNGAFQNGELFFGFLAVLIFLCIINGFLPLLSANAALGIFFAYRAYRQGKIAADQRLKAGNRKGVGYAVDALAASGFCILSLMFSGNVNADFMMAAGTYLLVVSGVEIGRCIRKKGQEQRGRGL